MKSSRICILCNSEFIPVNGSQKYCKNHDLSGTGRSRLWRQKNTQYYKQWHHERYVEKREQILLRHRLYYAQNPDKAEEKRRKSREYYARNAERLREYRRKYVAENYEKSRESDNKSRRKNLHNRQLVVKKWIENNRERYQERLRQYRKENLERILLRDRMNYYRKRYPDGDPQALIAVRELEKKLEALQQSLRGNR